MPRNLKNDPWKIFPEPRKFASRSQTSANSTVRVLSLFRFCPVSFYYPDSVRIFCLLSVRLLSVSILSAVRMLSAVLWKRLSVVYLSDWTRTRQRYPDIRYFARSRLFWLDSLNSNMLPPYIAPNNPNWLFICHWMATWWQLDRVETANLLFETS